MRIIEESKERLVLREVPYFIVFFGISCIGVGGLLLYLSGGAELLTSEWQLGSMGVDTLVGALVSFMLGAAILFGSAKVTTCVFDSGRRTVTLERVGVTGGESCEYGLDVVEKAFLKRGRRGTTYSLALAMRDHEVPTLSLELSGSSGQKRRLEQVEKINRFLG